MEAAAKPGRPRGAGNHEEPRARPGARGRRLGKFLTPWLWLLPGLVVLVPFFLFPIGILLRNSFNRDDPTALMVPDFNLGNYARVLSDAHYANVFTNSLSIALGVTVITLVVGYPFAYYLVRWAKRSRTFLIWALYTPLIVSVIVRVFGWMVITADSGLINTALLSLDIIDTPLRILFEVEGLFLGLTHRYLPLMVLPLVNALSKIDPALLAASSDLGASGVRTMLRIVIPLSIPGIVSGSQLVFAGVLSDFVLPNLLGTTRFRMLAPAIFDEAIANVSWASAAAMAVVMLVVVMAVLLATNFTLRRVAPWARGL